MQKAERQSSEHNAPTAGDHEIAMFPSQPNYELDTGINRGELPAGYNHHEIAGRQRSEVS